MQCKLRSLFSPKKIASHHFNCICTAILAMPDNLGLNFLCFSRMDPNWYIFTEHYLNMYILLTIIVLKCIYISKLVPFTTLFSDCIKCWHLINCVIWELVRPKQSFSTCYFYNDLTDVTWQKNDRLHCDLAEKRSLSWLNACIKTIESWLASYRNSGHD